mgnify:CR=1 FL=1
MTLKPGVGEIAFDFIKESEIVGNEGKDDTEENENEDFGQDITFPINDNVNNDLFFKNTFNSYNSIEQLKNLHMYM